MTHEDEGKYSAKHRSDITFNEQMKGDIVQKLPNIPLFQLKTPYLANTFLK
jgi:hypothetical protein